MCVRYELKERHLEILAPERKGNNKRGKAKKKYISQVARTGKKQTRALRLPLTRTTT